MKNTLNSLSDAHLLIQTKTAASNEKKATLALLEHLAEVDSRKAYAIDAHASLFDYIVRELGYSESQASERVNAVRLMRQNPEAKVHLESGALTLTTAAMVQRFFNQEKKLNARLPSDSRQEIIETCTRQSKRAVDAFLMSRASNPVKQARTEKTRIVAPELTEIKTVLNPAQARALARARELFPDDSLALLLDRALRELIAKKEKQMGKTANPETSEPLPGSAHSFQSDSAVGAAPPALSVWSAAPPALSNPAPERKHPEISTAPVKDRGRFIPANLKRAIHSRSGGQCEWRSAKTGERCPSRSRLQIDHIRPLALGGATTRENLRHLCSNHNARAAVEKGIGWVERTNSPRRMGMALGG